MNPKEVIQLARSDPRSEANLRLLLKILRGIIIGVLPVFQVGKRDIAYALLRELTKEIWRHNRRTMHGHIIKSLLRNGVLPPEARYPLFVCHKVYRPCIRRPASWALARMDKRARHVPAKIRKFERLNNRAEEGA
jgi:hypothetical protein